MTTPASQAVEAAEREKFETWAITQVEFGLVENRPDYRLGATRDAWKVWQARAELARPQEVAAPVGEADMLQVIDERDSYHEVADDLAAQIAAITGQEIGEHSSANDPWRNAMLVADEFIAQQLRDMVTAASRVPVASVAEPVPLSGDLVIKALLAMDAEARKRGEMFPQTADEQERDTKAVRNVIESLEFYTTGNQCRNGRPSVKNWPNLPATPPVGAGGAGVMDARPDSFHSDSGECGRVQGPGPTDAMNYKGMWLAAVSTLAKIDALLGLPEDGCNDPDMTLSALQDYIAGIKDIVGSSAFTIEDVRGWIAQGQARALAIDPDAAILASKGGDQGEGK